MAIKFNMIQEYEWLGEFWFSGNAGFTFPGILSYTPKEGVLLSVVKNGDFEDKNTSETIHGYTIETGPVTLVPAIHTENSSLNIAKEIFSIKKRKYFCKAMIIGEHFEHSKIFEAISFKLNDLDEFCHPQGFKLNDDYSDKDVLKADIIDGEIKASLSLKKVATGRPVKKISKALVLSKEKDEALIGELDVAISAILEKYKKSLTVKTDIEYELKIKINDGEGEKFENHIKLMESVANLFSILMLKTVKPIEISLLNNKENGCYKNKHSLFLSLLLDQPQVQSVKKKEYQHLLPVNINGIKENFGNIFETWNKDFATNRIGILLPTLLTHINGRYEHIQHYILLLTAIEEWSISENAGHKNKTKFDLVIETYGNEEFRKEFKKNLPFQNSTIGDNLSKIRNFIVHPASLKGKKNKCKKSLDILLIANLSEFMFILLVIALYKKLGIDEKTVKKVSDNFIKHIKTYHS